MDFSGLKSGRKGTGFSRTRTGFNAHQSKSDSSFHFGLLTCSVLEFQ